MHDIVLTFIGSQTCSLAGTACANAQALNMGVVVLGFLAVVLSLAVIAIRRRERREGWYV